MKTDLVPPTGETVSPSWVSPRLINKSKIKMSWDFNFRYQRVCWKKLVLFIQGEFKPSWLFITDSLWNLEWEVVLGLEQVVRLVFVFLLPNTYFSFISTNKKMIWCNLIRYEFFFHRRGEFHSDQLLIYRQPGPSQRVPGGRSFPEWILSML